MLVYATSAQELHWLDEPEILQEELLGRGHKQKKASILLRDYVTHSIHKLSPSESTRKPQHSSGNPYPIAHHVNCNKFSSQHRMFLAAIHAEHESTTYYEAVKRYMMAGRHATGDTGIGGQWNMGDKGSACE